MTREAYEDDEENNGPKSSYSTYLAEGAILFKQGEFKKAIESYSLALEIKENDPTCLVARSKCYLKLGDPQKALQDAETVLSQNKDSIKGLCQKAEALYCIGDFEFALVYYHRGHKLCPELDEFRLGIQKAQEAIENSIGKAAKIKLEAKGDLSFFSKQDDFGTKKRGLLKTPLIQIKPLIANRNKDVKLPAPSKKTVKQLLGELYADKEYLERLINDDRFLKNKTQSPIYELVQGGLNFLDTRTEFWRQQRPIYARKKEVRKVKSTVKTKSKSDVGKYVLEQLEDIDLALGNFDPERGLRLAKNLLKFVKEIDEKELPHKTEVIANTHSCIGNALIDLEELPKALKHHQRDLQISKKSQSDVIGISRALGNIGRVKAKMGKFEEAIQSWEEKMQYIKTPLESTWLYHELGRSYLELNSLDTSISYGLKSLAAAKEGNDEFWQLNANVLIAQAYGNQKNFENSIAAFEEALSLATSTGDEIAKTAITKALHDTKKKSEIHAVDNMANSSIEQIEHGDCQILSEGDQNMFVSGESSNNYKYDSETTEQTVHENVNNTKDVYTECDAIEQLNECDEAEEVKEIDSTYDVKNQNCESLDSTTNTSGNDCNIISKSSLNTTKSDQMSYDSPRSEMSMNLSSSDANVSSKYDGNSIEESERDESELFENSSEKLDDTLDNFFETETKIKRIGTQFEANNAYKSGLTPSLGLILENFLPGKEVDFIETHTEHRINETYTEHLTNEIHTEHLVNVTCNELQTNETCTENLVNETHTVHQVDETHTEHRINETCIELQINETHTKHTVDERHTEHRINETHNELQVNETCIEHKVNETRTEYQINKVLKIETHVEHQIDETDAKHQINTTENNESSDEVFNYETSFQANCTTISNEHNALLFLENSVISDENLQSIHLSAITQENESLCNESTTITDNLTLVSDNSIACNESSYDQSESSYNQNETSCNQNETTYNQNKTSYDQNESSYVQNESSYNQNETSYNQNETSCNQNETTCNQNETTYSQNESSYNKNETLCNQSETTYNQNETSFDQNETSYDQNEISYDQNESSCNQNEISYNQDETLCNQNETTYNLSETTYNQNETSCDQNETTRNQNETTSNQNETTCYQNETTYNQNETSYDQNKTSYNQNESSYNQNESSYNQNESSYNQNESSYNQNESSYNQNESLYNQNESVNFSNTKISSENLIVNNDNEASNDSLLFCNENLIEHNEDVTANDKKLITIDKNLILYDENCNDKEKVNALALDLESKMEGHLEDLHSEQTVQLTGLQSEIAGQLTNKGFVKSDDGENDLNLNKPLNKELIIREIDLVKEGNNDQGLIANHLYTNNEHISTTEDCAIANNDLQSKTDEITIDKSV